MAALSAGDLTGDRLRLGAVRERTPAYTSYDVTYRATSTDDRGTRRYGSAGSSTCRPGAALPAVVLAHGYIDPAVYVRGQDDARARVPRPAAGYVALHVDYRNHAESTDDPRVDRGRCGWATPPT